MRDESSKLPPPEIASAVNLMAHPLAGAAAVTAVSLGLATQMFGVWLGAMTGAAQATQRAVEAIDKERRPAGPAAPRRESATVTSLADVRAAAPKARAASTASSAPKSPAPRPATVAVEAGAHDDLKLIDGVGPKVEKVLNGMGVRTFAQIAAWSAEETARFDKALSMSGRIERDAWVAQAARLAKRREG
jgi:NADH-quinone oxidoreductase subunit E